MAIHRTISDFKSALQGGGARPNLFEVSIPTFPVSWRRYLGYQSQYKLQFLM